MTEELLDGADVVALLQQMGGENECRKVWHVAGLAMSALRTASLTARWRTDSCVVAAPLAGQVVHVDARRREDPLPPPLAAGVRILARQRPGQLDPARAMAKIDRVRPAGALDVGGQVALDRGRRSKSIASFCVGWWLRQPRVTPSRRGLGEDVQGCLAGASRSLVERVGWAPATPS
jgi:hypothetical protein